MNALILTTVGRTSGRARVTPVNWFPGEDGSWLIMASAAGAKGNPGWYYNLSAHPDKAQIEVDGRTVRVVATQLHGEERDRAWRRLSADARVAETQSKTDRELPIIRLTQRT